MAPASNEEQFKFLISSIRYSNNGKVDFGQVAAECKIVSKGAAAKRYERIMRAYGVALNAASIKPALSRITKTERRAPDYRPVFHKKRKSEAFIEDNTLTDDDEGSDIAVSVKPDPTQDNREQLHVKEEEAADPFSLRDAANMMQYYDTISDDGAQLGQEDANGEYDADSANGYTASLYGLHAPQYELYSGASMNGISASPRSSNHEMPHRLHYSKADNHGDSESLVVAD